MSFLDNIDPSQFSLPQGYSLPQGGGFPGAAAPQLNEANFMAAEGPQANGAPQAAPAPVSALDDTPEPPAQPQGFLSRLTQTTPDGLTFGDRLTALGSILKGDSAGARDFLQNQRANADVLKQRADKKATATASLAALRGAMNPDGTMDWQKYLAALPGEGDPSTAIKLAEATRPEWKEFSTANGGAGAFDARNPAHVQVLAKGVAKPPSKLILKPGGDPSDPEDWVPNTNLLEFDKQQKQQAAAATAQYRRPAGAGKANPFAALSTAQLKAMLGQ